MKLMNQRRLYSSITEAKILISKFLYPSVLSIHPRLEVPRMWMELKVVRKSRGCGMGPLTGQPFLHPEKVPIPTGYKDEIDQLRSWLRTVPHYPALSDEHLILFLHSCYFKVDRARKTIENYLTMRSTETMLFSDRDPRGKDLSHVFTIGELAGMPKLTDEGYRVLVYRVVDTDPNKVDFMQAMKAFFAFNDVRLSLDGVIAGYVVIFDMKGIMLSHLGCVTISAIRKFMHYIQECHPCRLKGVHVINTVSFIDKILLMVKPFVKSGIMKMLHFHGSQLDSLFKYVPQEVLSEDYGGNAPPVAKLHKEQWDLMARDYEQWFVDEEKIRIDDSKRPANNKKPVGQMEGSFRSLAID